MYIQLIFGREPRILNRERIFSSINSNGKLDKHMQKNETELLITKINSKCIKDLKIRLENVQHLA